MPDIVDLDDDENIFSSTQETQENQETQETQETEVKETTSSPKTPKTTKTIKTAKTTNIVKTGVATGALLGIAGLAFANKRVIIGTVRRVWAAIRNRSGYISDEVQTAIGSIAQVEARLEETFKNKVVSEEDMDFMRTQLSNTKDILRRVYSNADQIENAK